MLGLRTPLLLVTLPLILHAPAAIAQTQNAEAVAKVAQAITVRIEGATQGSGVLVKREGNRYTVLTAWHVVSGQRPGEELDLYTPDGRRHSTEKVSMRRLGEVDLAVLTFFGSNSYEIARIGDITSVSSGSSVYVSGFPLPTSAVPTRILRFLRGDVIANATVSIPNGYQLLYSNPTLPGMSGGAVLNIKGQLVGIHGQGETDSKMSEQEGIALKTGTNQAVPINYYKQHSLGAAIATSSTQATTADDHLAKAKILMDKTLLGEKGNEQEIIRRANLALTIRRSSEAYYYRAYAKYALGDKKGAILDLSKVITIDSRAATAYANRGAIKSALGDPKGAITDYTQAIKVNPKYGAAYYGRGNTKAILGDMHGAIIDYNQTIKVDSQNAMAYFKRGNAKSALGDNQGAIKDYNQAINLNPRYANSYANRAKARFKTGNTEGAITDINSTLEINPKDGLALFDLAYMWKSLGDTSRMCEALSAASAFGVGDAKVPYQKYCGLTFGK